MMGTARADHLPALPPRAAHEPWQPLVGPFECFGQRWTIHTTDRELAGFLAEIYAPMLVRDDPDRSGLVFGLVPPSEGRAGLLLRDGQIFRERETPAGTLGALIWAVNRHVIDDSDRPLILHAAAAAKDGAVVVLPAPMESGKTTLVTGLLDRGWCYLTDEAAALRGDGTVEGYPKPLSIDPGSWEVLRHHEPRKEGSIAAYLDLQWQVAPASFTQVERSGPLRLIVMPRYERGRTTTIRAVPPAEALIRLARCSFRTDVAKLDRMMVAELAEIVETTPVLELTSEDLAESCEALEAALAATTGSAELSGATIRMPPPVGTASRGR